MTLALWPLHLRCGHHATGGSLHQGPQKWHLGSKAHGVAEVTGKLAGGGEDVRKESSSPLTALIAAPTGSVRLWRSARCPPLLSIPACPLQPFSSSAHISTEAAFPQPSPRQQSVVLSLSPACLTEVWSRLWVSLVERGLAASAPTILPGDLAGAASRTKPRSANTPPFHSPGQTWVWQCGRFPISSGSMWLSREPRPLGS